MCSVSGCHTMIMQLKVDESTLLMMNAVRFDTRCYVTLVWVYEHIDGDMFTAGIRPLSLTGLQNVDPKSGGTTNYPGIQQCC